MKNNGYFPLFVDISRKQIVVIGGGRIALRRIRTLLMFAECVTVIAPEILPELEELGRRGCLSWQQEVYRSNQLAGAEIVLACTDDRRVNDEIYHECRQRGILVNVCSDREKCDFYFPGVVKKENVVVGITAGGRDHKMAKAVREKIAVCMEEE